MYRFKNVRGRTPDPHSKLSLVEATSNENGEGREASNAGGRSEWAIAQKLWAPQLKFLVAPLIMGEQLVQGWYAVAWGRFEPATLRLQTENIHSLDYQQALIKKAQKVWITAVT